MEEFKKSTPPEVRTYLEDQKVREVRSAAVAADRYELTHKVKPGSPQSQRRHSNPGSPSMRRWQSSYNEGRGGRVKASSTVPGSAMCEENHQGHDGECHKVRHSESPKSDNSKVRDNLPRRAQLSESKGSCGVTEVRGKVDLDGTKTKGEHDKARRTPCHHVGQSHFVLRDAKVTCQSHVVGVG